MKRIALVASLLVINAFSDGNVNVSSNEAIQLNHDLIKILFKENELLRADVANLKNMINESTKRNELVITESKKTANIKILEDKNEFFVAVETLNVRAEPRISATVKKKYSIGTRFNCTPLDNEWCKISQNEYVWVKGFEKINKKTITLKKDTALRTKPTISINTYAGKIEKGSVIESLGTVQNKWYLLNNGLFITSDSAFSY